MKTQLFALLGIAAIVASSCEKSGNNSCTIETLPLPVITATGDATVKTTTDDGARVLWKNGDSLALYVNGADDVAIYKTATATPAVSATFDNVSGTPATVWFDDDEDNLTAPTYRAIYPPSARYQWGSTGKSVTFNIPYEQTAVADGWDPTTGIMAANGTEAGDFAFKHCASYIKFVVGPSSPEFVSVAVSSINSTAVADRMRVYFNDMSLIQQNTASRKRDYVLLKTSDGNAFPHGTYYICVIAKDYPSGLAFTFKDASGKNAVKLLKTDVNLSTPGKVANIGTIGSLSFASFAPKVYDTDKGVVFYANDTTANKGKVLSAFAIAGNWFVGDSSTAQQTNAIAANDPESNYNKVVGMTDYDYDARNYAQTYCDSLRRKSGGNWHLPSRNELEILYNTYNGKNFDATVTSTNYNSDTDAVATRNSFDALFSGIGGSGVLVSANYYWSDRESSDNKNRAYAFRLGGDGWLSPSTIPVKYSNKYTIRCVMDVTDLK